MIPLALAYAQHREPEAQRRFVYDAEAQLNLCEDGTLAARNWPALLSTAATSSTAGSKQHLDDA